MTIDSCHTSVSKSTLESRNAENADEKMIEDRFARANERTRTIAGSITGDGWVRQRAQNAPIPAIDAASTASVRTFPQPHPAP